MADRITNIISKTANKKVSDGNYANAMKKALAESVNKRLDTQMQATKDKIAAEKDGDKDNKIIEGKAKKYKGEMEKDVSPFLKKCAKEYVHVFCKKDPKVRAAKEEAYDKCIDEFVKKACEQIDNEAKSLEEYRVVVESVIRSCHDSINNDPELKKEIDKQILSAIQDAILAETMELMNNKAVNNIALQSQMYVNRLGQKASMYVNKADIITSMQVDDLIKAYTQKASKNVGKSIADHTFRQLTKIPIIGTMFKPFQTATEKAVEKGIKRFVNKKMNNQWANEIKSIKAFQKRVDNLQIAANMAISKAEEEAKTYMAKLEQKAINEIKKFVNLDNLSIGGFKL